MVELVPQNVTFRCNYDNKFNFLTYLYFIHVAARLSAELLLTLQATILLSTDAFIFLLQCYISAHKRQAEDKGNKGWTET